MTPLWQIVVYLASTFFVAFFVYMLFSTLFEWLIKKFTDEE